MAEYTDDDVDRLAVMLRQSKGGVRDIARRLLERGVTLSDPPPDPAVVVAEYIWRRHEHVADLRDLFPPEALEAAAAKVQEARRG